MKWQRFQVVAALHTVAECDLQFYNYSAVRSVNNENTRVINDLKSQYIRD